MNLMKEDTKSRQITILQEKKLYDSNNQFQRRTHSYDKYAKEERKKVITF